VSELPLQLGGVAPQPRWSLRLTAAATLAVLVIGLLAVKLAQLQVTDGSRLAAMAQANTIRHLVLEADRGIIYDRHGAPLVENSPVWSLVVVPAGLPPAARDRAEELVLLARLTGVAEEKLAAQLLNADPFAPATVKANLSQADELAINERLPELPGASIAQRSIRRYGEPMVFGHVLGYVGPIDSSHVKSLRAAGYQPDEMVGKVGVEAGLEELLRGTDGWADVEVDARGQVKRVLETQAAVPGHAVYLSLDAALQRATAASLAAGLARDHKTAGASVVIDPRTGEVLAMISLPAYDTNLFTRGISQADFSRLLNDPDKPLLNRAIAGQYAPGSTFKMVTATAGLQEGKITAETLLACPPYINVNGWIYHNWASYSLGRMNVARALATSCDTFFYQVASMVGDVTLARYARAYGFGTAKAIEMPGVAAGLVPDRIWKQLQCGVPDLNSDECRWSEGDTITFGIGQSYLLTTPLNQAVYVATLAGTPPDHLINGRVQCREGGTWAAARGGAVRSVAITPAAATVVAGGGVVRLRAVLRDSAGNRRVGPAVTWTSTAPDVATVASSYSVTADVTSSAPGTATIIATAEGLSGSASITVETIALASIEAGAYTTCGLTPGGAGYCWGDNTYAELGSGTWAQSAVPQAVAGGLTFAAITVGGVQTCGLTSNGTPHCWGDDVYGELGAGTSVPEVCGGQTDPCSPRPIAVAGGHAFSSISAGWGPTCALTAGGAAYCWGDNSYGQLGIGTGSGPENCRLGPCSRTPVAVQGGPPFVLVSAGAFHVCALTAAGAAYCWGDNIAGELGTGSATGLVTCAGNPCIPTPTPVAGGLTFTTLRVGFAHTCGRTTDGTWYCWGSNNYGQLGNGTTGPELCQGAYPCSTLPVAVAVGTDFSSVTPGYRHSCGITSGGAASCWGANSSGQLGDGTFASDSAAVTVAGGLSFASVSAYVEHTCGITTGGVAYCWGRNTWGELGDGQQGTDAVPQPIRVAGQTGAVATAALRAPNGAPAPGRAPPAPGRRPSRP